MTFARPEPAGDANTIAPMPGWVTSARAETPEDVAFLSGAALGQLHMVVMRDYLPQRLVSRFPAAQSGQGICVTR